MSLKAIVISPTAKEFLHLLSTGIRRNVEHVLEKFGVKCDTEYLQIRVPGEVSDCYAGYTYEGKMVLCITPEDYGSMVMKDRRPELFVF